MPSVRAGKVVYQAAVNGVDVTGRLLECVWEHTTRELSERAIVEIALHPTRDDRVFGAVGTGAQLLVRADGAEVFVGRIEGVLFTEKRPVTLRFTAYAQSFMLGANEDTVNFPDNYTALDVMRYLASPPWSQPFGRVDWPDRSLGPAQPYREKTLGYIVEDTNRKLRMKGAGDFVVRSNGSAIDIVQTDASGSIYAFTADNTEVMTDEQSTQDLVTRVRFVGSSFGSSYGDETSGLRIAPPTTIDNPLASPDSYGTRQRVVSDQTAIENPEAAAEAMWQQYGEPQRVQVFEAPDVPGIKKGDAVSFRVGTVDGVRVLTGVHHDAKGQVIRMEIDTTGRSRVRVSTARTPAGYPDLPTRPEAPVVVPPDAGRPVPA